MKSIFNYINKSNGNSFQFCLHLNFFGAVYIYIYIYTSKYIAVLLFLNTAGKHIYAGLA